MSNVFITPSASTISRDQIIDVTVTVDISNYSGTLNLELSQGAKTKILGNRGSVKIYDFGSGASNPYCTDNTSINCVTITPPSASATFKFVYNSTGTIKIKATDSNNCAIFGESTAISVNYQIRKYTEKFSNPTVNNYDSIISSEVNTWSDWKIPPASPYAFISGASPEIDLIKAIAFKESSLKSTNEPNLMQLTSAALNGMGGNGDRDPNASAVQDASGCYSLCEGAPQMNYNANINSVQDSFHWGIRWYIAKRSVYDYNVSPCVWKVSNMRLLPVSDALTAYGDGSDGYAQSILDLFHEGKNPNGATPIYLWPIKTDGCPRQ